MRDIVPWSFSSWEAYQTCPRQFYETKVIKKYPFERTEPIIWGEYVHKAIEVYVRDGVPLPDKVTRFKPIVDKIANKPGDTFVELDLACTKDLHPTGFWDNDAYVRGKGDIIKVNGTYAFAGDWKTGKRKTHSLQLSLMAVMTFAKFPEVTDIGTGFLWFQEPARPTIARYNRAEIPSIMAQFEEGVRDMQWSMEHNNWPEKPSGLCRGWCPVKDCKHWRPKREY